MTTNLHACRACDKTFASHRGLAAHTRVHRQDLGPITDEGDALGSPAPWDLTQPPTTQPKPTKEKPAMAPKPAKPTTCQIENAPHGLLVRIHAVDGKVLDAPEKGSFHKVTGSLFSVRSAKAFHGTEFKAGVKVTFRVDEADVCAEHNEPKRQRPGGAIRCTVCVAEYSKARRTDGGVTRAAKRAEAKTERQERVIMSALHREEKSREQLIGVAVRTSATTATKVRGSDARRNAYRRAHLTAMVAGFGVSIDDAANWAGIPAWEPMTWAQYRKDFGSNKAAEATEDAA